MKTTMDISDHLLQRAKRLAREEHLTLRSLTEEGLSKVLDEHENSNRPPIRPVTFGGRGLSKAFRGAEWPTIRDAAYEEHGS